MDFLVSQHQTTQRELHGRHQYIFLNKTASVKLKGCITFTQVTYIQNVVQTVLQLSVFFILSMSQFPFLFLKTCWYATMPVQQQPQHAMVLCDIKRC